MSTLDTAARISVVTIAVVVVFAALDVMQNFAAPVVLAVVTAVVFSPVSDRLEALGLGRSVAAFLSVLLGLSVIAALFLVFQPAVERAVNAFPKLYSEMNSTLFELQNELRGLREVEESVKEMVEQSGGASGSTAQATEGEGSPADAVPSVEDVVLLAPAIFAQVLIFLGTFFFFVLTKREIYQFAACRFAPSVRRAEATARLRSAERKVARYFLTITLVNLVLGMAVAAAMIVIGMPSPVLWGLGAFVLNFLIYLGPAAFAVALLVAGVTVFDGFMAVVAMAIYLTLNLIESQFVTPAFLGKSLSVNPLLIFLTVTFFLWLWGPLGAIVAIPLLLWGIALAGITSEGE